MKSRSGVPPKRSLGHACGGSGGHVTKHKERPRWRCGRHNLFRRPIDSKHGFLTANDVTPYTIASLTLKDGPIVVEVPAATDKVGYFGTILDAWQLPVADVGPTGDDQGKGGKYLLLPPDYKGKVPTGYRPYRVNTMGVALAFRPVPKEGVSNKTLPHTARS